MVITDVRANTMENHTVVNLTTALLYQYMYIVEYATLFTLYSIKKCTEAVILL